MPLHQVVIKFRLRIIEEPGGFPVYHLFHTIRLIFESDYVPSYTPPPEILVCLVFDFSRRGEPNAGNDYRLWDLVANVRVDEDHHRERHLPADSLIFLNQSSSSSIEPPDSFVDQLD